MATIRQLITGSLRLINVVQANETPTAADIDISLESLRGLLGSWSADKLSIFVLKQYYFPTVAGQKDYTLGTGGDWNIQRPMAIERATLTYNGSITLNPLTGLYELATTNTTLDIPMEGLTDAQYAAIPVKNQQATYPVKYYDNGNYPLRTVSVWPVPTTNQPITLWLVQPLWSPDTLDQELNFPKGYERAIRFNLAIELAPEFGKTPQPEVAEIATASYGSLKRGNSRNQIMLGDNGITAPGPGIYNYNLATTIPN